MIYKNKIRNKIQIIIQKDVQSRAVVIETIVNEFCYMLQLSLAQSVKKVQLATDSINAELN